MSTWLSPSLCPLNSSTVEPPGLLLGRSLGHAPSSSPVGSGSVPASPPGWPELTLPGEAQDSLSLWEAA